MKEVLETKGYTVIEAADGEEALQKFTEQNDVIDLIVLDVVMPRKNGKEVYDIVKSCKPDMKVLFTSGYTGDIVLDKGIHDEAFDFISKPLSPNELLLKIRKVISTRTDGT